MSDRRLVLASASPRRIDLLGLLGHPFDVEAADVDERRHDGESVAASVERLALDKARVVWARHDPGSVVVVGADTVVVADGEAMGKPVDDAGAAATLRFLRGRRHEVLTGVAVIDATGAADTFVDRTTVTMAPITDDEIAAYVATGEPLDKAGSYAIQGFGGRFVAAVDGNVHNVVGLPTARLAPILTAALAR